MTDPLAPLDPGHLDPARLDALLEGLLPPEETRRLRAHLAVDCPTCAAALGDGPDLDLLARLLDAEAAPPSPPPADLWDRIAEEAPWAHPLAVVRRAPLAPSPLAPSPVVTSPVATSPVARSPIVRAARRWWPALALAAAALLAVPFIPSGDPPLDGVKGPEIAPEVHLRAVVAASDGGALSPTGRVADGDHLDPRATLLFELETLRPSARYLFVVDAAGVTTWLSPTDGRAPAVEPAGRRRLGSAGAWVALDLSDLTAPITLVAAASPAPLDPRTGVLGPWLRNERPEGVAFDTIGLTP